MEHRKHKESLKELSASALITAEESKYASFEALSNLPKVDDKFLDAAWSSQPSLERDFALH